MTSYEDYLLTRVNINLITTQENYTLPTDYYKTKKMFFISGSHRWRLKRFNLDELDFENEYFEPLSTHNRFLRYRVMGNEVFFSPRPLSAGTVEHWYTPQVKKLVNESDVVEVYTIPGWEEFVVTGTCIKMLMKEESDPSAFMMEKQQIEQRIINAAADRDEGEPHRVTDVDDRFGYSRFRRGWR